MMTYEEIIKLGLEMGLEEMEIYAETSTGNVIKLFDGELSNYNSTDFLGVSIRGLYNGKMSYVYTENLEKEEIEKLLHSLIENAKSLTSMEEEHVYGEHHEYHVVKPLVADYANYSLQEKIAMLKTISSEALAKDERIVKIGYCQYHEAAKTIRIINSKGLNLSRSYSYLTAFLGAVASDGTNTTLGFGSDVNTKFKELETTRIVDESTKMALGSLGAGTVKSGEYEVVFSRDVASEILDAFSSIFMGESALRNLTILTDKEGQKVFGDNITIVDDPFSEVALIQIPFDDEGVPCVTKEVVKDGVFTGFLHSLKTAEALNKVPTGNGFKPGVSADVTTSCTNMYLKPGTETEDELIAGVKDGIYVTEVNGLHAGLNPISGAFNVQSTGYLIKDGKKSDPVTLFVISGNFFELMNNVTGIANNIEKRYTGVVSPSIRVKKLVVSGK